MTSRISRSFLRILAIFVLLSGLSILAAAQRETDVNYESPTPILLSEATSTRALAQSSRRAATVSPSKIVARAFSLNSKIILYVSDLRLMSGEGANAFRIYAEDSLGHGYRYPVLDIQPSVNFKNVWEVTTVLTDESGYWEPPTTGGDLLIYLTWRGLASNKVKIGIGKMGGETKESADAKPTPLGTTARLTTDSKVSRSAALVSPLKKFNDHARFLEQATFGPQREFDSQFAGIRLTTWINNQFNMQYPSVSNPYPDDNTNYALQPVNAPLTCNGSSNLAAVPPDPVDTPVTCFRDSYTMYPMQTWNSKEMLYGTAQLRHRVSWALSQIWVTSGVDIQQSRHMAEHHKILSANAFGNYRTLMQQMTLSPTMGDYLSMSQSTRLNPNENYAREIMQLFSVGLFMLNPDGTVICVEHNPCQTGDTAVPSYDQNAVNNLTKVLTGWSFCQTAGGVCPALTSGTVNFVDPMLFNGAVTTAAGNKHDISAKTLLVYDGSTTSNIAACPPTGAGACGLSCLPGFNCTLVAPTTNAQAVAAVQTYANNSLNQALNNIFYHPNLGPYVSKLLIQQMVTSDPTPAYVGRVAAAFNDNGFGVRGDMKAVIMALLTDPEARGSFKTDPNYGKLREPVQFAANILRSLNVRDAAGIGQSDGVLTGTSSFTGMSQVPFRSPTVFNYYPPNFVIPGTSILGPEFALMTTGTAIQRANFVNQMTFGNPAVAVSANTNSGGAPSGTSIDLSDLQAMVVADSTGGTMVDELNRRMLHSTMSPTMRSTILTSVATVGPTDTMGKVRQALYLIATSSQYQVQR